MPVQDTKAGQCRSFDKLRTSGIFPFVVSLSNHGGEALSRLLINL